MENTSQPASLKRYSLSDAQECIAYYKMRAGLAGLDNSTLVKAYSLRTVDFFEALGIAAGNIPTLTHPKVRVYLGMQNTGVLTDHIYKMFMVPVNAEGVDQIPNGPIVEGGDNVSFVYDFNTPCPNTCDLTSPLYKAGEPK